MSSACHAWKLRARTSVVTVASTLPAPRLGWKRGTSHACESLCGAASEGTAPCQTAALSQTCCFRVLSSTSTTSGCARERPTLLPRAKARSVARAGARAAGSPSRPFRSGALSSFVHQTRRKNSRELLFFLFWRARARSVPHAKRSALSKPVLRERADLYFSHADILVGCAPAPPAHRVVRTWCCE